MRSIGFVLCLVACAAARAQEVTLRTDQGDIVVRLFPEVAPGHARNFVEHARSGFYAGTTFHRVVPGFVLQGGDPNTKDDDPGNDGQGGWSWRGPGTTLALEPNDRPHTRGTLSMARSSDPDSAGSQFFIVLADQPQLDRQYTVFGEVARGMDVVDRLVAASAEKPQRLLEVRVGGDLEPLEIAEGDRAEARRLLALEETDRSEAIERAVAALASEEAGPAAARLLAALGPAARGSLWRLLDSVLPTSDERAEVDALVRALGDDAWSVREEANRKLLALDPRFTSYVQALEAPSDPEVRERMAAIRAGLAASRPAWLGRRELARAAALGANADEEVRDEAEGRVRAGHPLAPDLQAFAAPRGE